MKTCKEQYDSKYVRSVHPFNMTSRETGERAMIFHVCMINQYHHSCKAIPKTYDLFVTFCIVTHASHS